LRVPVFQSGFTSLVIFSFPTIVGCGINTMFSVGFNYATRFHLFKNGHFFFNTPCLFFYDSKLVFNITNRVLRITGLTYRGR
jgi:hypothetical protein